MIQPYRDPLAGGVEARMVIVRRLGYRSVEQHGKASLASGTGKIVNGLMNSMERHAVAHGR